MIYRSSKIKTWPEPEPIKEQKLNTIKYLIYVLTNITDVEYPEAKKVVSFKSFINDKTDFPKELKNIINNYKTDKANTRLNLIKKVNKFTNTEYNKFNAIFNEYLEYVKTNTHIDEKHKANLNLST